MKISTLTPVCTHTRLWEPREPNTGFQPHAEQEMLMAAFALEREVLEVTYNAKTRCASRAGYWNHTYILTFSGIGKANHEYYWFGSWYWRREWSPKNGDFNAQTWEGGRNAKKLYKRVLRVDIGLDRAQRGLTTSKKGKLVEYAVEAEMPEGLLDQLCAFRRVLA